MALTDDHLGVESLTIAVEPRAPIEGPSSDLEEVIVRVNGATVLPLEETFADGSVLELTHNPDLSYSFSDSIAEINEGDAIPGLSDGEGTVEVAFQDASLPFPTGGDARASRLERVHHGLERSSAVGAIECLCAPGAPLQGAM